MKVSSKMLQSAAKALEPRTGKTLEIVQGCGGGYYVYEIAEDGTQRDFFHCGKQTKKALFDIINVYCIAVSRTKIDMI